MDESDIFSFCFPGFQEHPDSVPEMGEDAMTSVSPSSPPPTMTEEERQELQEELVKVRRDQGLKRPWFKESRSVVGPDWSHLESELSELSLHIAEKGSN